MYCLNVRAAVHVPWFPHQIHQSWTLIYPALCSASVLSGLLYLLGSALESWLGREAPRFLRERVDAAVQFCLNVYYAIIPMGS